MLLDRQFLEGKARRGGITDGSLHPSLMSPLFALIPAQLAEKTIGNFDEGTRVTTYGDLKAYRDTENALIARIETIMQTGSNLAAGNFSRSNSSDWEAAQVGFLAQGLRTTSQAR